MMFIGSLIILLALFVVKINCSSANDYLSLSRAHRAAYVLMYSPVLRTERRGKCRNSFHSYAQQSYCRSVNLVCC